MIASLLALLFAFLPCPQTWGPFITPAGQWATGSAHACPLSITPPNENGA